ncbi:MAG: phenylalanine--tRNA ligase subunit beta [Synergistaceae bacterium]|nr:phenylalanine--tRNA ligase subunit beta [Synergistaceae bacterium]
MLVSYKLINEFITFPKPDSVTPEMLAERLTFAGVEVESARVRCEKLNGAVVAKITNMYVHPRKETWNVAELDIGGGKSAVCVTAAANLKTGDVVPYGPVGTVLADGTVLSARDFDGVTSEGMLLSADELGVPEIGLEHGILRLNENSCDDALFAVGNCVKTALGLDDVIFDLSITPNRGDLLSVIGLSREIKGLFPGSQLKDPAAKLNGIGSEKFPYEFKSISLPDKGCLQYSLGAAVDIKIAPSPIITRVLLTLMGMRPISNMVDVTNLAMLVTGQPLHAFDLETLPEREITVRSAEKDERMTTLDGKERILAEQDMLITSGGVPVGIAGVMGGLNSEIRPSTTRVALESASFEALRVSHTSRRLGIQSEAAHRYARVVDTLSALPAMNYALGLMSEWGAAKCGFVPMTAVNREMQPQSVVLTKKSLHKILLWDDMRESCNILEGFGFKKIWSSGESDTYSVPSWRPDVSIEEDLIEEVGRFRGYNDIEPRLPQNTRPGRAGEITSLSAKLRSVLLARGYNEALTYTFLPPSFVSDLNLEVTGDPRASSLELSNPISADMSCMRTTILPGLIKCLQNNIASGWRKPLRFFEQGRVYFEPESEHIAGVVYTGKESRHVWNDEENFFTVKADVLALGSCRNRVFTFEKGEEPFGHTGQTASVMCGGKKAGFLLRLKPAIEESLGLSGGAVYAFELDASFLIEDVRAEFSAAKAFPAATRDISVIVPADVPYSGIISQIREAAANCGDILEGVSLFDIYDGKGIPEGTRSLAFSLSYRASDHTLKEEEIEKVHGMVRGGLEKSGYILR